MAKSNITTLTQLVLILSMAYHYTNKIFRLLSKTSTGIMLPLVSGNPYNQPLIAMNQSSQQQNLPPNKEAWFEW